MEAKWDSVTYTITIVHLNESSVLVNFLIMSKVTYMYDYITLI